MRNKQHSMEEMIQNIELYKDMVYRLAAALLKDKYDADDVFQEVFLRYVRKNPDFESDEHKKAWFIRVTINCCKKHWKSSWNTRTEGLDEEKEAEAAFPFESREESEIFHIVKSLPDSYRIVIHLFYFEDMKVEEISHMLKRKPSTVRTQLTRARRKLKEMLKEKI